MTMSAYEFLLPAPDAETQPWWDAARRHELVIQACADCGTLRHAPRAVCSACGSEKREWRRMSGRGTLYSYVTVHRPTLPMWRDAVPYNVVMVALDEAPEIRLHGNVIGVDNSALKIGMPLEATFDDVAEDDTIIRWQPASPSQGPVTEIYPEG
jgi:uncharacterized protein